MKEASHGKSFISGRFTGLHNPLLQQFWLGQAQFSDEKSAGVLQAEWRPE
jgi:hypothetical protein